MTHDPTALEVEQDSFAERLKAARQAQGLSFRKLAAGADCTAAHLCDLEGGKENNPTVRLVENVARALKVSPVWLAGWSNEPSSTALSQARDAALEGGWQPIETAPRDGRYVLVAGGTYEHPHGMASLPYRGVSMARWDKMFSLWEGHQVAHDDYYTHEPTHWMPLPSPPHLIEGQKRP